MRSTDTRGPELTELIGPFAAGLAALYLFHAVTFAMSAQPRHVTDAWWCVATAMAFGVVAVLGFRGSIRPALVEPVAVAVAIVVVADSLGYLVQTGDAKVSTDFMLLLIGSAVVFPSSWSFGLVGSLAVVAWLYAAATVPSGDWGYFGYAMVSGLVLALLVFLTRRRTVRRLEAARAELRDMAVVDEVTGLHNRRGFLVLAEQAMLDADRTGVPFTLLFARVVGGHDPAPALLRETASLLRAAFRGADVVARVDGDRFCVLLPDALPGVSYRDRVHASVIEANARAGRADLLTLSVGEARYDPARPVPVDELLAAGYSPASNV